MQPLAPRSSDESSPPPAEPLAINHRERHQVLVDDEGEPIALYNGVLLGHEGYGANSKGAYNFTAAMQSGGKGRRTSSRLITNEARVVAFKCHHKSHRRG
eukprot:SAG22_NODE_1613_length_3995_cov_4.374230_3_plen_100_part_00